MVSSFKVNNPITISIVQTEYSFRVFEILAEPFEKFSLQPLPQIESRPFKLILKETQQRTQIPFPILDDPSVTIQIDFVWEESIHYKFQLLELYQNLHYKVKH